MRLVRICFHCARAALRLALALGAALVLAAGVLVWAAHRAPVPIPPALLERVEARVNAELAELGITARLDGAAFDLRANLAPAVVLEDLQLRDRAGDVVVALDHLEAVFSRDDALRARPVPKAILARGVQVALSRDAAGRLTLRVGDATLLRRASSPAAALARLRAALRTPRLAGLRSIGLERVGITLHDVRDGRRVSSRDGALRVIRDAAGALTLDADLGVFDDGGGPNAGRVTVRLDSPGAGRPAGLRLALRGLEPARMTGLAGPGPLADLLSRLRAPVSFELRGRIGADGGPRPLSGALRVGAGRLRPPGGGPALDIEALRADLTLSADRAHLAVRDLALRSAALRVAGRADLRRGGADGLTAQLALSDLRARLPRRQGAPIVLAADRLWADLHLDRNSGALRIGALSAERGGARVTGQGRLDRPDRAAPPRLALDLQAAGLDRAGLFALWPAAVAPRLRGWLDERLSAADVTEARLSLRHDFAAPDAAPDAGAARGPDHLALEVVFRDGALALADGLPPLRGARGHAMVAGHAFGLRLTGGRLDVPGAGDVALIAGRAHVARLGPDPAPLVLALTAEAGAGDTLALLRAPFFQPRRGSAQAADAPDPGPLLRPGAVQGRVRADITLTRPARPSPGPHRPPDFSVTAAVTQARSDTLLAGRVLRADRLEVSATPEAVTVTGPATIDGQPFDLTYTRPLAPGAAGARDAPGPGRGRVVADLPVTAALLRALGAPAAGGLLDGAARARLRVDLSAPGAPRFDLQADLSGLGVSLPALGLSKARADDGTLAVSGRLPGPQGGAVVLEDIALRMPGARIDAAARLRASGGLADVTFSRLALGRWLDARGRFAPGAGLSLTGGTLDLRRLPGGLGAGGAGGLPGGIDVALETVRVADALSLTQVRGTLSAGLRGTLTGRIGGAAPVRVRLGAGGDGSPGLALHVTAGDAGAVLRAANLVPFLEGGAMDLRLVPADAPGTWRGRLRVDGITVRDGPDTPGFLSQDAAQGPLRFSDMRAEFTLSRTQVRIGAASATGPSLGVSLDGRIDLAARQLALQGVVSPIYFLNRVGSVFTRRGEGLFGVHYTVTGPLDAPEVAANPLSMLTPGFLREIFRAPDPSQEGRAR